jgi:hypothetical protein
MIQHTIVSDAAVEQKSHIPSTRKCKSQHNCLSVSDISLVILSISYNSTLSVNQDDYYPLIKQLSLMLLSNKSHASPAQSMQTQAEKKNLLEQHFVSVQIN